MVKQEESFALSSHKISSRIDFMAKLLDKEFFGHFLAGALTSLSLTWLKLKTG